jgi:ATP-binding protein involved in chromosome partitioning
MCYIFHQYLALINIYETRRNVVLNREQVEQALKNVKDVLGPGDVVSEGRVEKITVDAGRVMLTLKLPTDDTDIKRAVEDLCRAAVKEVEGVDGVMIMTKGAAAATQQDAQGGQAPHSHGQHAAGDPWADRAPIPGVKHIIAVSSAKGGVGKSTVCVNLALALQKRGARVGIMDADVYGPSIHVLLNVNEWPTESKKKEVAAVEKDGLKLMSLGFLMEPGTPVIWRGPMVVGVVKKFLQDVDWGELDYLMIDMPPGTGDAQLTLVQTVPLTGAVIVTTSSELALVDAEKGLVMYRSVETPVMGIIENMSHFVCPHCNERTDIFGHGEGPEISKRLDTEFLGDIPLDPEIRTSGDRGNPIVKVSPDSSVTQAFLEIADRIMEIHPR